MKQRERLLLSTYMKRKNSFDCGFCNQLKAMKRFRTIIRYSSFDNVLMIDEKEQP